MCPLDTPTQTENTDFPAFSLPARRDSAWVVETRPDETRKWLETRPLVDPAQSAQHLYQALFTLNRMDLDVDDRLPIMELYRQPVSVAINGLQSHFTNFALPLRPRLKQLADFIVQLQLEMAHGYKHVLMAARQEAQPWKNEAVLLTLARSIHCLGEVMLRAYQVYMPTPVGVWRDVHSLYRYAEAHGRQKTSLAEVNDGVPLTVAHSYLQVLMLGLCGPYQLPQNECFQVNAFLARWADKADISARLAGVDPTGHFLLDLEADHPALPFPRDVSLHASLGLRAVNAIELARTTHDLLSRLKKGDPVVKRELGFECIGSGCADTLKRMLRFWGLAGRRHFTRRQFKQPLSLCVGLNAIHFFTSGQRPFTPPQSPQTRTETELQVPSAFELEAEEQDETTSTSRHSEVFRVDTRWQVRDESAGGLSLARRGDVGPLMRVGDVLGIHDPGLDQWRISVVRWLKSPDTRNVEMGIEMLAPNAQAFSVRPAGVASAPYSQALLLPPAEALRQPATLLVARGLCQAGEDIELADQQLSARRVRVLHVVERSNAFSRVVFADVSREDTGISRSSSAAGEVGQD